jgi:hypothetical protein
MEALPLPCTTSLQFQLGRNLHSDLVVTLRKGERGGGREEEKEQF